MVQFQIFLCKAFPERKKKTTTRGIKIVALPPHLQFSTMEGERESKHNIYAYISMSLFQGSCSISCVHCRPECSARARETQEKGALECHLLLLKPGRLVTIQWVFFVFECLLGFSVFNCFNFKFKQSVCKGN